MRVFLVLFAAVAVVLCSEAEETTMSSSSTTTTTSSTTTAEATTILDESEEGTKTKRTIGNSLGYGYNDIGDGRAFYSHPAATQQQYQTVRYYHAKAAQDQPQQYHQESPQHSQTVYSKPQQSTQPQQHSIFSNALLSQHINAQQHPLLGAGQHSHFLGAAQQSPFLGAAQQNHLLSAAHQNPLLALQHGGSPFLSSGGAPFLYQQPGQHNFLQQSQLFGGPHVIPVIILRVSDPAQHGLVTPAFIQPNFPAHQPLHNMLVQYLQQTVQPQTQTAYYPEHQQAPSQSTKPLYVQQQLLVTPTPEKKQQLLSSSASQKPRKTAVSIEQAQNLDNSFAQYSKYSQYKDKV